MTIDTKTIAKGIAKDFGIAGSTNLVQWALLALLIGMLLAGSGAWWIRSRIATGDVAKVQRDVAQSDNKALAKANKDATETLLKQQKVVAESSRRFEEASKRLDAIALEAANEREDQRRQFTLIREQMEQALSARPDLAAVHVGSGVLDVWNAANRGRANARTAFGAARAVIPTENSGSKSVDALPGRTAGSKAR